MASRALVYLVLLLPVAALRTPKNSFAQKADVEALVQFVAVPKVTLFEDITENFTETQAKVGMTVTPVQMEYFKPLKIMTGEDKLSSGMQKSGANFETNYVQMLLTLWRGANERGNLLDVGANMGAFTLPFALNLHDRSQAVVISVEALPTNRHLLRASIKENNLKNIHLYEYAVGNVTWRDNTYFWSGGGNSGHAAYSPKRGNVQVPVTTLDSILNQDDEMKKVFAMKIDIEGTEPSALDGGKEWLTNYAPCVILTEMNRNDGGVHDTKLHNTIIQYGYERHTEATPGARSRNALYKQKDMQKCIARLTRR